MKSAREAIDGAVAAAEASGRVVTDDPTAWELFETALTAAIDARDREHAEEVASALRSEVRIMCDDLDDLKRSHADEIGGLRGELADAERVANVSRECRRAAEVRLGEAEAILRASEASLATVTADRDAWRSAADGFSASLSEVTKRLVAAEAALASSLRMEDVVRWLREQAEDIRGDRDRELILALAAAVADGSWLRDLTTMDGRPAEAKPTAAPWSPCQDCWKAGRLDERDWLFTTQQAAKEAESCSCGGSGTITSAARPDKKETDNG